MLGALSTFFVAYMNPKNQGLTPQQKDFIKLLAVIKPGLTRKQIQALYESKFNSIITDTQLRDLLHKLKSSIDKTKDSEALTLELARNLGLVTLSEKINRIIALEDIANKCINGDPHEIQTSRGEVVVINKKDFSTAINAIKAIKEEVGVSDNQQSTYVIHIGDAVPPKTSDYEELEGDDEL